MQGSSCISQPDDECKVTLADNQLVETNNTLAYQHPARTPSNIIKAINSLGSKKNTALNCDVMTILLANC